MEKAYSIIHKQLSKIPIDSGNYEALIQCYILARLNIRYSAKVGNNDGLHSEEFRRAVSEYHLLTSSNSDCNYIYGDQFPVFCTELVSRGMDKDYPLFLEIFAPYLVSQWDQLVSKFASDDYLLCTIYHILRKTSEKAIVLSKIGTLEIGAMYNENLNLWSAFNITADAFVRIWQAIYYVPMPQISATVSRPLVEAVRFYRAHKISGLKLVQNYCEYNRHKTKLDGAYNPWIDYQRVIRGKRNTIEGVTTIETAFNHIENIKDEKPSDIIRAALYPFPALFGRKRDFKVADNNDGRFECSFFLQELEKRIQTANHALIVNPGPDFLVAWSKLASKYTCKCRVAVPNYYVAMAYRLEFKNIQFCIFSDVKTSIQKYDLIVVVSTNSAEDLALSDMLISGKENASFFALLPQTMLSTSDNQIGGLLQAQGYHLTRIVSIASQATVTKPNKKMLIFAEKAKTEISDEIPVYYTQYDSQGGNLIVEKSRIFAPSRECVKPTTLNQLRQKVTLCAKETKHRNRAFIYKFSEEIELHYTIHIDKHNTYVGEAYYKKRKLEDETRNQPRKPITTQKGLRSKEENAVIAHLEDVPYYEDFAPSIIGDIQTQYANHYDELSLKTIWFCCRSRLLIRSDYDDVSTRNILFGAQCDALSSIHPKNATEDDYRNAMQCVIPADSKAIVKYWQLLSLIMRIAVENHYAHTNPIPALLTEVSKHASKELRNLRNMLTKKTFTFEEEARIIARACEETKEEFGERRAYRFEKESIWLLGPMRLFTGMSTREVCALTWSDYEKIPNLNAHRLIVYKFIADDGSCVFHLDEKTSKYSYRKVPVAPFLAEMLNSRRIYLKTKYGYSESEVQSMPIVMASEMHSNCLPKHSQFCRYSEATKICCAIIEDANIPVNELILPGTDEEIVVDMNKYYGDIFYSNFKHRANHTCAFRRGELAYVLGNKAPDTFSQHYCDFSSDLIQYGMAQKLHRWTYLHEYGAEETAQSRLCESCFTHRSKIVTSYQQDRTNAVDVTLISKENLSGSYIDIEIDSDHGLAGRIVVSRNPKEVCE